MSLKRHFPSYPSPRRLRALAFLLLLGSNLAWADACVVLLHGWGRTSWSMQKLEAALDIAGYHTVNLWYKTRGASIEELADHTLARAWEGCGASAPVHFVTHSMGGLLVRQYFVGNKDARVGRVVMLGPPNQGTPAVNRLLRVPGMAWMLGPAARELGVGEDFLPSRLPPVNFELGVIAGTRVFNPLLSMLVEDPDDGAVSVAATEVQGMCAHLVLPVTHSFMMRNDIVIDETLQFLREGRFTSAVARNDLCARAVLADFNE